MRTLKKTLAFVLVLAMVVSLGAMGASAAFTDTDDSSYDVAIDVMSGIGVIDGMTATTFDPAGSLTREQAAKIIAYMLLGPVNAKLISTATNQKFSDVAKDRWSAGYIEYCANVGIIAGVGDGKFDPTGVLTTCAFTKMVLCALGYKADVEGLTGESWAINTASLAVTAKITDDTIPMSSVTACTREEACQIAFKALSANLVKYTGGSTITVGGVSIVQGATREDVTNATAPSENILDDNLMQFAEKYFKNLTKETAKVGGRNGYYWKNGVNYISDFVSGDLALATSTDGAPYANLISPATPSYIKVKPDTSAALKYYYNNFEVAAEATNTATAAHAVGDYVVVGGDIAAKLYKVDTAIAVNDPIAAVSTLVDWNVTGTIVNFLDTDFDSLYEAVSIVQKQVASVTGPVTTKTTGALTKVTIPGVLATATNVDLVSYPSDLAKGDVVLFYASGDGKTYIEKADSVTGKMTGYNAGTPKKITVDSSTYTLSGLVRKGSTALNSNINTVSGLAGIADVTYYLDDNGSVCFFVSPVVSTAADKVLFVVDAKAILGLGGTYTTNALVVRSDGSTETIKVAKVAAAGSTPVPVNAAEVEASEIADGKIAKNTFYTYTTNTDGSYNLTAVEDNVALHHFKAVDATVDTGEVNLVTDLSEAGAYAAARVSQNDTYAKITNSKANFLATYKAGATNWAADATQPNILANNSTIFVLKATIGYNVYTGINNVPNTFIFANNATVDVMVNSLTGYASLVVVGPNNASGGSTASSVLLAFGGASYVYDPINPYFTIGAYVDGVENEALKMAATDTLASGTLYTAPIYTNGIVTSATPASKIGGTYDTVKVSDGLFAVYNGSTYVASYVLSSTATCYVYNSALETVTIVDAADLQAYLSTETVTSGEIQFVTTPTSATTLSYVVVTIS